MKQYNDLSSGVKDILVKMSLERRPRIYNMKMDEKKGGRRTSVCEGAGLAENLMRVRHIDGQ